MRKILNALVIVPLALILLAFAVANRQFVMVSFDPFDSTDPSLVLTLPLFIVIIAAAIVGVIAGGLATWFGQRRWRRAARRHEAEAYEVRQKLADLQGQTQLLPAAGRDRFGLAPSQEGLTLPGPGRSPQLGIGQDKSGATL